MPAPPAGTTSPWPSAGLLERAAVVRPLTTADYPTPAQRPSYSLLDCSSSRLALALDPVHWGAALAEVLEGLQGSQS
jgi:dTDP-4-dehydrorhamnose reductase